MQIPQYLNEAGYSKAGTIAHHAINCSCNRFASDIPTIFWWELESTLGLHAGPAISA